MSFSRTYLPNIVENHKGAPEKRSVSIIGEESKNIHRKTNSSVNYINTDINIDTYSTMLSDLIMNMRLNIALTVI